MLNMRRIILNLDLDPIVNRMVGVHGWSFSQANKASIQYKRYLCLVHQYGTEFILPPSLDIDEFWHNHILHTKKYHGECNAIFGKYLHHHPGHGKTGDMSQTDLERMFEQNTQRLYFDEFGEYIEVVNSSLYKLNWRDLYEKIIKLFVRNKKS